MKKNNTKDSIQQKDILFEDNHLIAVFKQSGHIVQGDKTGDQPLSEKVKLFLKQKYQKPGNVFCGVIHRIDRPVSGIVLFAKTGKALERMNKQFQDKLVQKTYFAISRNRPEMSEGRLSQYLVKNEKLNKSFVVSAGTSGALLSVLDYELLSSSDRYHLLKIDPQTGRHHQIRVQLSSMGSVITGDLKYGDKRSNPDASICLHAGILRFLHPVSGEPVEIQAAFPDSPLWNIFKPFSPERKAEN